MTHPLRQFPVEEVVADFRTACVSRAIDDRELALQAQSRVFFQIAGAGHEALGVGLARSLRAGSDWFFPYYRDQALVLALGVTPTEILLQAVGSSEDPASGGRQMPNHWGDPQRHIVTQSSPTASQCLPAVGCAEAGRYLWQRRRPPEPPLAPAASDEITYVSLGEGACSEGEFWESLNTACTLRLPVLYVVADNGYAISVPVAQQGPAPVSTLVGGFPGLAVHRLDGTDYAGVRRAAADVVAGLRGGSGPALIHAAVTRPYSHSGTDRQALYRPPEELAADDAHDPIERFARDLVEAGILSTDEVLGIRAQARAAVADAASRAVGAARPDPAGVLTHVVSRTAIPSSGEPTAAAGAPVALGQAVHDALAEALAADERVRVFGEDVADAADTVLARVEGKGGVFGTTKGLQRRFGSDRCYNTPLAEAAIVGRAVGQALRGLRPVPEIQFFDYIWPAMTQLRSEAATIRWRSNGKFSCPMVVRVAIGGYLSGGAIWHSQCGESIFAHIPGLSIAFPSRAADAVGLLRAALAGDDPVLFCEHKHLLRQRYTVDPYPGPEYVLAFGRGARRRAGTDCTIVTWGATVEKSLQAASTLAEHDGVDVEVIDLRTISPWDQDLVADAVAGTHRLLVVHEDTLTAGFGAEIAAWVGEHCFGELDAPVRRLAAQDCPVAYAPDLEVAILPQADDVVAAVRSLVAF
jgi:2-oxoisovalerate dehydrogenase E1 component